MDCGLCIGIPIDDETFEKYPDNVQKAWANFDKWVANIHKNLNREITQEDMNNMPEKVKQALKAVEEAPIPGVEGKTGKDSCYMITLHLKVGEIKTNEIFRLSNVGVSCKEFTLLRVAGPNDLPPAIRERMDQHLEDCKYHGSKQFNQSVLNSIVTPELEKAALEVIKKYCGS